MSKPSAHPIRSRKAIIEGCLFLVLALALGWHAVHSHYNGIKIGWELSPYLFPLLISIFLTLLSFALIAEGFKPAGEARAAAGRWRTVLVTALAALAYFLLMPVLGFVLSTTLFLLGMFLYLGERRALILILVPLLFSSVVYILFGKMLYVMLPSAPLDFLRMGLDLLW